MLISLCICKGEFFCSMAEVGHGVRVQRKPLEVGHGVRVRHSPRGSDTVSEYGANSRGSDTVSECAATLRGRTRCSSAPQPLEVGHGVRVQHKPPEGRTRCPSAAQALRGRTRCPSVPIVCGTFHRSRYIGTYRGSKGRKKYFG